MASTVSMPIPQTISNFDEISMQQSLLFSDSLKDLKNLRLQLYSAAEYFELSYTNDDQKHLVIDTLKDYVIKALVNTVDHLGSVMYKVNDLLDKKVDEMSGTELKVSCIEQRLCTCKAYVDHEGLSQQSLIINTPKYHKRYILPDEVTMHGSNYTKSIYQGRSPGDADNWHHFKNAVQAAIRGTPALAMRKGNSSPRQSQQLVNFSFSGTAPKKEAEKRAVSPHRFPLLRSGSLSSRTTPNSRRPVTPNSGRPTTPNASAARRYPSEPQRSTIHHSVRKEHTKDVEQHPSKSIRLLKSLLTRRKSKKDDMLYTYLDEY